MATIPNHHWDCDVCIKRKKSSKEHRTERYGEHHLSSEWLIITAHTHTHFIGCFVSLTGKYSNQKTTMVRRRKRNAKHTDMKNRRISCGYILSIMVDHLNNMRARATHTKKNLELKQNVAFKWKMQPKLTFSVCCRTKVSSLLYLLWATGGGGSANKWYTNADHRLQCTHEQY